MDRVAINLKASERQELFAEVAAMQGRPPIVIEKDFWVCWVLHQVFSRSQWGRHFVFKGGTSLSKVHNIIERFSEDIDLIIDWCVLGYGKDEPLAEKPSKTKQDRFNKEVVAKSRAFLASELLEELKTIFSVCQGVEVAIHKDDPDSIVIQYPAAFSNAYILPQIKLEIGPMASWVPSSWYNIKPYAAEAFPEIFQQSECKVLAIEAIRTFWEKITILHQQAHRSGPMPSRYSRHYYDVYQLETSGALNQTIKDMELLNDVVKFKQQFYPCNWARYDLAEPGTLKLVPPDELFQGLATDYSAMKQMIFGATPGFDEIMACLKELESKINGKKVGLKG
jgi:hypothetical protein